jgi:hypothetical protein
MPPFLFLAPAELATDRIPGYISGYNLSKLESPPWAIALRKEPSGIIGAG